MYAYYSKGYLREVRTFEASIQWKKIGHGRQTVGQRAGVSQLPGTRQKSGRGCLPLLDGAGKKQRSRSVLEVKCIEGTRKVYERLSPAFSGKRVDAVGRLLVRELGCHSWLARAKTIMKLIDIVAEIQIVSSYFPAEEIRVFGIGCLGRKIFQFMKYQ